MLVLTLFPSGRKVGAPQGVLTPSGIQIIYGSLLLSKLINLYHPYPDKSYDISIIEYI